MDNTLQIPEPPKIPDDQVKENINFLIQRNGGWFVTVVHEGEIIPGRIMDLHLPSGTVVKAAVIGEATAAEAIADVKALGFQREPKTAGKRFAKVMID